MAMGKRVFTQRKLVDPDILKGFVGLPASNIGDSFERIGCMDPRIKLMSAPQGVSFVGSALTIKSRGGDNLLIHYVLENIAKEGDFLIVSNEGCPTRSVIGQNMACSMQSLKLAGIVIDGPIRDLDAIREMTSLYTPLAPARVGHLRTAPARSTFLWPAATLRSTPAT